MVQFARGNNLPRVKLSNQSSILRMIYHCGPIKRAEIAERLGLTLPTITTNINNMIADGVVQETDAPDALCGGSGRKARLVDVVPESRHFLGVEMQGYRRVLTVVDFRGRALFADIDERPCDGYEENMELVRKMIHRALEATGLTLGEIDGIGFCVPGLVNSDSGVLDTRPSYGWLRKGIRADAAAMLAYDGPISVENNACARAYGAQLFQWEKLASAPTFAYLLVTRGIACPLVLNTAETFSSVVGAGEVGHMVLEPNGRPCSCGNRGCLEAYASDRAVLSRCAEAMTHGRAPILRQLCPQAASLTMDAVVSAQAAGDLDVTEIVREALTYLGVAVANINNFACPRVMMIDGALFQLEENRQFLLDVNYRNLCNVIHTDTEYLFLEPDAFSGARGAAARAICKHMEAHVD